MAKAKNMKTATTDNNVTTWNCPTPLQRNEQQIERLEIAGVIQGEVTIHLFLRNAQEEAVRDASRVAAIFEGLEGFYWVVPDWEDAERLIDSGYLRLPKHHLEDSEGISVVHEPSYRDTFELDARGRITFDLGDDVILECEVRRYNGKPRLRIYSRSFSAALSITPESGNVVNVTAQPTAHS
jgi:hypothetical protein